MKNIIDEEQDWTEVITPKAGLFDIRFAEIWRYKDLLALFVKRDFVATYKQTILGPIWHFVQPILTTLMFFVVFRKIANIPTEGVNAILFYMSSITIWNYFAACFTGTSSTFVSNASIFGKVYFPRLILPISTIMSNIVKLGIQFLLFVIMVVIIGIKENHFYFSWTWLLIPVLVLIMAGIGLGWGIILSSLTTKYRDLTVLIGFGIQLLMYATPVVYPLSYLAEKGKGYLWAMNINPLTPVVEGFRYAVFNSPLQNFQISSLLYSIIFMLLSLFAGMAMFNKVEKSFMDTV